ncbi:hypothetical protein ACFE04_031508 [Oxalis oulophora]
MSTNGSIVVLFTRSTMKDLSNNMGSFNTALLAIGAFYCGSVQSIVSLERIVSYRERAARMYSALPYAIGQWLPSYSISKSSIPIPLLSQSDSVTQTVAQDANN